MLVGVKCGAEMEKKNNNNRNGVSQEGCVIVGMMFNVIND